MNTVIIGSERAVAKIIVSSDASASVQHAARELKYFIAKITGISLPIVSTITTDRSPFIALGAEALADAWVSQAEFGSLPAFGKEDFVIREKGGNLLIAGGEPRGTLYGVYTFLEDYCGCRWFTSTCSRIPNSSTITVPGGLDVYKKPIFEYRETDYSNTRDGDWSARNKNFGDMQEHQGGRVRYTAGWFVHTFDKLVSVKDYGEQHPEYFAMVKGERNVKNDPPPQLCLSNPDVLTISIENALKALRSDPTSNIISISQNDHHGECRCPSCQQIVDEEGSYSGLILRFVNMVAEAIEQEFPEVEVDTLAYVFSRKPPRITKPRRNVIVRLCSIECCFTHPFDDCRQLSDGETAAKTSQEYADFAGDVEGWSRLTDRLYIWDYISNFRASTSPFPNLQVLAPNLRFFSEHGVKGVFSEGIPYAGNGGEMAELRSFLIVKLLWDPHYDVELGMQEFLEFWFGAAAEPIQRYINLMRDHVISNNYHIGVFDEPIARYLEPEILEKAGVLFDEAELKVKNSPLEYARVLKERLSVRYPRFYKPMPIAEREEMVEAFMRDAAIHDIREFEVEMPGYDYIRNRLLRDLQPPKKESV